MMATFGVPHPCADDAVNALRCAELMMAALAEWNEERRSGGHAEISMGIGLNYGPAVLGDLGGEHGMAFAVIGDTVNTSSRLQDLTRILGTPLIVGDALVRAIETAAYDGAAVIRKQLRLLGERQLRGRTGPIKVWTLAEAPAVAAVPMHGPDKHGD